MARRTPGRPPAPPRRVIPPRRRRPARLLRLATAALVAAATASIGWLPAAPAAAQDVRPPGVPPRVDLRQIPPQGLVDRFPFDHSFPPSFRQDPATPVRLGESGCVQAGDSPDATVEREPWGQARLRIDELHRYATGKGQVIAVIDTGVEPHPRFGDRLQGGGDYLLGDAGQDGLDDCDGHGTLVAGIIGASADPSTGFVGIAPDARIVSIRQSSIFYEVPGFDQDNRQTERPPGDTRSLALAVMRAVDAGATVINISEAACFGAEPNQVNALDLQAAVAFAASRDIVVVAAAGNVDQAGTCRVANEPGRPVSTVSSPAWFDDDVLAVGAITENGQSAPFSLAGPWVDVSGPGTDITSLNPAPGATGLTNTTLARNGEPTPIQGTSFSTPYVAGLAALIKEKFPGITAREVMHRIEATAQQAAGRNGRDDYLGHGMIDPVAALNAVVPPIQQEQPPPPRGELTDLVPQPEKDPLPTRVAVIGTGSGLLALAVTGFVVFTVARHRANRGRTTT